MAANVNLDRFAQLLEMASHEGTPANEAYLAARQARRMLDTAGLSFRQIRFRRDIAELLTLPTMEASTVLLRRMSEHEATIQQQLKEITLLKKEVGRLRIENTHLLGTRLKSGTSKWKPFWAVVTGRLQKTHGAYQRFCDRYNEATGQLISEAVLRRWAQKDEVPELAVEFAKSAKMLRISQAETLKSDQQWTMEELTEAESLMQNTNLTTNQIGSTLGKRFGRRMDKHTIMNAKQRIFLRQRTLEIYDGGEADTAKILHILKEEFPTGYGVSLKEVHRFIGKMRDRSDLLPRSDVVAVTPEA